MRGFGGTPEIRGCNTIGVEGIKSKSIPAKDYMNGRGLGFREIKVHQNSSKGKDSLSHSDIV